MRRTLSITCALITAATLLPRAARAQAPADRAALESFRDSLAGLTPADLPALRAGSDAPTEVRVSS